MHFYKTFGAVFLAVNIMCAAPAQANMEQARDLMEAGEFTQARALLDVYARSGNAEAEELIGVMYALGLGGARDDERAFEWYLRASMKGHAGAQSGVGWYYEVGRGAAAPATTTLTPTLPSHVYRLTTVTAWPPPPQITLNADGRDKSTVGERLRPAPAGQAPPVPPADPQAVAALTGMGFDELTATTALAQTWVLARTWALARTWVAA